MKQEIKQELMPRDWDWFTQEIQKKWIMWDIIRMVPWPALRHALLANMLMSLDNLHTRQEEKQEEDKMYEIKVVNGIKAVVSRFYYNEPCSLVCRNIADNSETVQEKKMFDDDFYSDETPISDCKVRETQKTRKFFMDELQEAYDAKIVDARTHFGLNDDDDPDTFDEFISRIQKGNFSIFDSKKELRDKKGNFHPGHTGYWVRWRSPDKKEDRDGFTIVQDKIQEAHTKAYRELMVAEPYGFPGIVEKFEKKDFLPKNVDKIEEKIAA